MKKILLLSVVLLMMISVVFAAQNNINREALRKDAIKKFSVGNVSANATLLLVREEAKEGNYSIMKVHLSNGRNATLKIMPNTASEKAIAVLQAKNCIPENGCVIQLKEVAKKNEGMGMAYEIKVNKDSKIFGLFKKNMKVQAEVDAETGEVLQTKKPWWAFLASE